VEARRLDEIARRAVLTCRRLHDTTPDQGEDRNALAGVVHVMWRKGVNRRSRQVAATLAKVGPAEVVHLCQTDSSGWRVRGTQKAKRREPSLRPFTGRSRPGAWAASAARTGSSR
jgi:hypothetical protein